MVILLVKFVLAGIPLAPWSCLAVAGLCESNPGGSLIRLTHLRADTSSTSWRTGRSQELASAYDD
ncbi:MAG TPA: hypothetical protein DCE39_18815 [Planctomycetaceae bacterium]|nr:hypothetical protein [Planctomycetaceae bacterium]